MSAENSGIAGGFGQRLRQLREGLGLSVAKFADQVKFDRSYVYRLEKGLSDNPSLNFVEKVVGKFGVDREWFIGGEGDGAMMLIRTKPARVGISGYVEARAEMVEYLLDALSDEQLILASERFHELATTEQKFGQIYVALGNITSAIRLRRMMKASKSKIEAK